MYQTLAHLRYPTHYTHIAYDETSHLVQCFKYNNGSCLQAQFLVDEVDSISEFIAEPLPQFRWGFQEDLT